MTEGPNHPPYRFPITLTEEVIEASDRAAGFDLLPEFTPFNQKDDLFRRSWWDPITKIFPGGGIAWADGWLDHRLGYGARVKPTTWWQQHVTK